MSDTARWHFKLHQLYEWLRMRELVDQEIISGNNNNKHNVIPFGKDVLKRSSVTFSYFPRKISQLILPMVCNHIQ